MADLGLFGTDDFSLQALTAAINSFPPTPKRIAQLKLFSEIPIASTTFVVEKHNDTLTLVPNQSRTIATPNATGGGSRSVVSFTTSHLPTQDTLTPDDIQNVRAFGSADDLQTMQQFVSERLAKMRRRIDATIEYQRLGAIQGKVLDSDGVTVIEDMFTKFGLTQQTAAMNLGDAATNVKDKLDTAVDLMDQALADEQYEDIRVLCGSNFYKSLTGHPKVEKAFQLTDKSSVLYKSTRKEFDFDSVIFEPYKSVVGGSALLGDDEAYMIPVGVPDLLQTVFAPANYNETANTRGLPYYAKQESKPLGKGILLEAQSNPMSICTRPRAIIKLTV